MIPLTQPTDKTYHPLSTAASVSGSENEGRKRPASEEDEDDEGPGAKLSIQTSSRRQDKTGSETSNQVPELHDGLRSLKRKGGCSMQKGMNGMMYEAGKGYTRAFTN